MLGLSPAGAAAPPYTVASTGPDLAEPGAGAVSGAAASSVPPVPVPAASALLAVGVPLIRTGANGVTTSRSWPRSPGSRTTGTGLSGLTPCAARVSRVGLDALLAYTDSSTGNASPSLRVAGSPCPV